MEGTSCVRKRRRLKNSNRRNIRQRLSYSPKQKKRKFTREERWALRRASHDDGGGPHEQTTSLKFGSFNVRGLDLETAYVVQNLLKHRGFDVGLKLNKT